jgi:hypothetical protein
MSLFDLLALRSMAKYHIVAPMQGLNVNKDVSIQPPSVVSQQFVSKIWNCHQAIFLAP